MKEVQDLTCDDCLCAKCSKADSCEHCAECDAGGEYEGVIDNCCAFHRMKFKKRSGCSSW